MKNWFINQGWESVYAAETAHEKAAKFQEILINILDEIFPEKIRKISIDDQPWVTHRLKMLDRKRKRIHHKERRSEKLKNMNKMFRKKLSQQNRSFTRKQLLS